MGKADSYLEDVAQHLERALTLTHWFGTLGGRSRNGWGSVALRPSPPGRRGGGFAEHRSAPPERRSGSVAGGVGGEGRAASFTPPSLTREALKQSGCVRPLARCLELDWPHAIGADEAGPLVWQSADSCRRARWR